MERTEGEEESWWRRFKRDFGSDNRLLEEKPSPLLWRVFYLSNVSFDENVGRAFSAKAKSIIDETTGEYQTSLQRRLLSGSVRAMESCLQHELSVIRNTLPPPRLDERHKSALHYAVLSRKPRMVEALLSAAASSSASLDINKNDLITGFTPLHFAVFVQSAEVLELLLRRYHADIDKLDNFFATPLDYARMLGMVPTTPTHMMPRYLQLWRPDTQTVDTQWPVSEFEKLFSVTFCPFIRCTSDYLLELMYSGFSINTVDTEFRKRHQKHIWEESTGDQHNVILAKIDDRVGYGVFAAKDFEAGDFIVRYGGCLTAEDEIKDKAYTVVSGVEGVALDAKRYRNFGGMMNHSATPNAELQCFFDRGAEQAIVTALHRIERGQQIFLDYSENYWREEEDDEIGEEKEATKDKEEGKGKEKISSIGGGVEHQNIVEMANGDTTSFPFRLPL
ncbi:SET domain-containing protein [Balamuthia mandrillaris]